MDINNLKAFIEVADKKSFSRSADSLQLTQPAVSKRIAALETELSARLFDRVGRSVHLTEAGRVLLPCARQISSELNRIEDVICNLGKEVSGKLSLSTTERVGAQRLPPVLKSFRDAYPNVDIDINFSECEKAIVKVEKGLVELALLPLPMPATTGEKTQRKLRNMEIWSDTLHVVVSNNHPLVSDTPTTLEQLVQCPAILPPTESTIRNSVDSVMEQHNLKPDVSVEANDFETIRSMTSVGLGWACLPEFCIDESLTVLNIASLKLKHSIALVRQHDRTLSRAAQAFLDTLPTKIS